MAYPLFLISAKAQGLYQALRELFFRHLQYLIDYKFINMGLTNYYWQPMGL